MNARTLQIMTVAALALAGVAWWSTRSAPTAAVQATGVGAALFPDLAKRAGDVSSLTVLSRGKTFKLEKQGDAWGAADKGGYPVNFDKVKDVVSKLAYFKILEKKTDRPELFAKLDLDGADTEQTKATRITLADASGAVLADVLIGKTADNGGPGSSSMYVRRPDENQTYEVSGNVYVDGTLNNWLDKQIMKLERTRVHAVDTLQPDGGKLAITKAAPDDKNYVVKDLPEGAELKWAGVADGLAGALEYLSFEDVEARGRIDFNDPKVVTTTLQTYDGLLVGAKVLEVEGKFYAEFSAKADPAARVEVVKLEPPPPVGPPAPTDPAADPATEPAPEVAASQEPIETRSVPGKSAEEVAKEAGELDAKLSKWTYVLPGYGASNFTKKLSDMIKEPAPLPGFDPNAPPQDGETTLPPPVDDGKQTPAHDGHDHAGEGAATTPPAEIVGPGNPTGGGGR